MVLIISQTGDHATDEVMDWLNYLGVPCMRLNGEEVLDGASRTRIELNSYVHESVIKVEGWPEVHSEAIRSIWYRRDVKRNESRLSELEQQAFYPALIDSLDKEYTVAKKAFFAAAESRARRLGNYRCQAPSKLDVLQLAKACGLDIPATILCNTKDDLLQFKEKCRNLITKAIRDGFNFECEAQLYMSYTEEVTDAVMEKIPAVFFPSLFQEKLEKELDLRIFYLDGTCYAMAIFSQLDKKTRTDFRKYNQQVNNRNVPYQLPETLVTCLRQLMTKLDLNTGSIDLVKTKTGRYVFLEVNPVGQYGMTAVPCNYPLNKKIATYLAYHG
jgi:ATP-GRASP peptide maturase of grasp-with-spasm system